MMEGDQPARPDGGVPDPTAPTQRESSGLDFREIGPYSLLREIGRGGMGIVYQARDVRLGRFVALKFLSPEFGRSVEGKARFLSEARAASALDHPGICTVFDIGESEKGLFLAMAYYEGESLAARLQNGPMPMETAVQIVCRSGEALAHAHEAGIVHRDVKPSNIFLTFRGEVKILDFGVAKLAGNDSATQPGMLVGTPGYMSPEQILGDPVDHRTDIWSLGVVLFELLTGVNPFAQDRQQATFTAVLFNDPPPLHSLLPGAPELLETILGKALAKNTKERYATLQEFLADLELFQGSSQRLAGGDLPVPLSSFIGRDEELDRIRALLPTVRVLTLTGTAGTGKTRLAIEAAKQLTGAYQHQVYFIPLASVMEAELVPSSIAQALGIRATPGKSMVTLLSEALRNSKRLLVLDNFEQVVAAGSFLAELLAACPQLQIMVTSRLPLHITGEYEFPVPPLTVCDSTSVTSVAEARRCPSVALFEERARATGSFELTGDNLRQVADLCVKLDGLPLAIELAASRTKLFSPEALLTRLANRMGLLKSGLRDRPARHQTLRQAIAWSYDLLDTELKAFFRRSSIFRGGFSVEAAATVVNSVSNLTEDPFDAVFALLDHSLVRQKQSGDATSRLFMLETIREFGLEMLRESGELPRAQQAHADYYLDLACQAEPELTGSHQIEWLDRLELEHDNFRLVLNWARESSQTTTGLRLSAALWRFWLVRGHLVEGYDHLRHFLVASSGSVASTRRRVRLREQSAGQEESRAGSAASRAAALLGAGNLAHNLGDTPAARIWLGESLALHRTTGDERGTAAALNSLAWVACEVSEFDQTRSLSQEALNLTRRLGDKRGAAVALNNLGWVANYQGDYPSATAFHSESLALRKEIGDERGVAFALSNLGWAEQYHGDYLKAEALLSEAIQTLSRLNDRGLLAWALIFAGRIAADQGDREAALEHLERSLALWRDVGNRSGSAYTLMQLGGVNTEAGYLERAEERLAESMENFRSVGCIWGCVYTNLYVARMRAERGDLSNAHLLGSEALEGLKRLQDRRGVIESLETLAAIEAAQGPACSTATMLAAAQILRASVRIRRPPAYEPHHRQTIDRVRSLLDQELFSQCWQQGDVAAAQILDALSSGFPRSP